MKHVTFKIIKFLTAIFLFLFLLFNLVASQLVSPLYFQLAKEDKNTVVAFLQKIKNLPVFPYFLDLNKKIYGDTIEQDALSQDKKRKETMAEFESLLQKNLKSRDLLYNLYLLYNEDGNKIKAEEYLKKAKEIDPTVK